MSGQELTAREKEVAFLVARGFTYSEIGEKLGISPRTVDNHVRKAGKRLEDDGRPARLRLRDWQHELEESLFGVG